MKAVIRTGCKQYLVEKGMKLRVELLDDKDTTTFKDVLLIIDGDNVRVGSPLVQGASVQAKVLGDVKGKKVIAFKYKPKKRYKRKVGHRQKFTEVLIEEVKTSSRAQT